MPKIYTKTGDGGETSLLNGRVSKTDPTIKLLGRIDSFSVKLGLLLHYANSLSDQITTFQNFLIELGSTVAGSQMAHGKAQQITALIEADIDQFNTTLPPLKNFVLPQGNLAVISAHAARTCCRKLEVRLLKVLKPSPETIVINRLSDWLFVVARSLCQNELAFQRDKGNFGV
jgi:cob(I)alamin adenosyltransferase